MTAIDTINALPEATFVERFGSLFEHSPWVAERVLSERPFSDAAAMIAAMNTVVASAGADAQLALVRVHPELARKVGVDPDLTRASQGEQASAGLDRLAPEEFARFGDLNARYREKFAMPFVICVRLVTKAEILSEMARRVELTPEAELQTALRQIGLIAGLRLSDFVQDMEQA